jgi:uncharacterized protein (DUF1810 family)
MKPQAIALQRFHTRLGRGGKNHFYTSSRELQAGGKQCQWIWFKHPQQRSLDRSAMGVRNGITDRAEAPPTWPIR